MSISLSKISFCTLVLGELLGFLSLALCPEASREAVLLVPLLAGLLFLLGVRIGDRILLALVAGLVLAGMGAGYSQPIALVLSSGLLAVHGLLWLPKSGGGYRYWRLGIAFFEIILAAILSPETHMFLIIFFFAVISSLALSFGFLERKLGEAAPRVPLQFLAPIFLLTVVIFLSSLLIFPVLPRSNATGLGRQWTEPGYTESVDFRSTISWAGGSSRPMLWIFLPEGRQWPEIIPHGLLRGAVLDIFDGEQWKAGAKQYSNSPGSQAGAKIEIFREPMGSNILLTPYGTTQVEMNGRERKAFSSGEWPALALRNRRVRYDAWLGEVAQADPPKAVHLEIPEAKILPTVASLAAGWNRRGMSEAEKVRKVLDHFRGFRWNLAPMNGVEPGKPHPVETFLSRTKEGHCELFATSAALLFRRMGMPARLVAGFRAYSDGDVLTARNTDAHAWVEVWMKGRGWVPVDPSPVVTRQHASYFDFYDKLNAYWYQYIVGYEFDGRAIWAKVQGPWLPVAAAGVAVLWLLAFVVRRLRRRGPAPRAAITLAWEKIERKLGRALDQPEADGLKRMYLELRFGPRQPGKEDLRCLKRSAADLARPGAAR
jgi:transglutaminase-like putative cysteine protease